MTNYEGERAVPMIIAKRYKVKKTLYGGMGVIYQCEDRRQGNRLVALKTYKPKYLSNDKFRAQFLQEAMIWTKIGWHPHIVQAYRTEYVQALHEIYLVLEWLGAAEGDNDPTLRSRIRKGELRSVEATLNLLLDVTRGMKYATMKIPGIIHRDLKPENIYIGSDGQAKISDFGLVFAPEHVLEALNGSNLQNEISRLRLGGTPLYMSPEQWRNRNISMSSDIYALGCIGLEMLSGDYIIRGRHLKTIAEEHLRGGALKRLQEVKLPSRLKVFLAKCLQTDPTKRFQDWQTVELELINLHETLLKCKPVAEKNYVVVSREAQVNFGETVLAIGEAYLDLKEIQPAIQCFENARTIGADQNQQELVASAEANLGLAYSKQYQYELAIYHFQRAIGQYWECGKIDKAFLNYGNISSVYFQQGDYYQAQANITKMIEYSKQISEDQVRAFWNNNLSNTIFNCGDKKSALEFLLYTLEVEEKQGSDEISVKFLEILDQFMGGWEVQQAGTYKAGF